MIAIGSEDGEVRQLGQPHPREGVDQADEDAAERRPADAAQAAHDHHDEREQEDVGVGAGADRQQTRGDHPGRAGQHRTDDEHAGEDAVDVDAHRRDHLAIVDPGAQHRADPRPLLDDGEDHADGDREGRSRTAGRWGR